MPRGDKRKYTDKQKRRAAHIEEGYEARGVPPKQAAARAWATVNAISKGGEKPGGSGYGKAEDHAPMRRGGKRSHAAATTTATTSKTRKSATAARGRKRATTAAKRTATARPTTATGRKRGVTAGKRRGAEAAAAR